MWTSLRCPSKSAGFALQSEQGVAFVVTGSPGLMESSCRSGISMATKPPATWRSPGPFSFPSSCLFAIMVPDEQEANGMLQGVLFLLSRAKYWCLLFLQFGDTDVGTWPILRDLPHTGMAVLSPAVKPRHDTVGQLLEPTA